MTSELIMDFDKGVIHRKMMSGKLRINVGTLCNGYLMVWDGKKVNYCHRLIWEAVNGPIPLGFEIDHINGVRNDNRLINLRLVNRSQNNQNVRAARSDNMTSGIKGVSLHKQSGKWRARIRIRGKQFHLGMFDSIEKAQAAYAEAASTLHTHNPHAKEKAPVVRPGLKGESNPMKQMTTALSGMII